MRIFCGLVQGADGLFEGALADLEACLDVFRRALVAQGQVAAGVFQFLQDRVGDAAHLAIAGLLQTQFHLAVRPHPLDIGGQLLALAHRTEQAVLVDQAPDVVVDHRLHPQLTTLGDDDRHRLARP